MSLTAGCPRCTAAVAADEGGWRCPDHGQVTPLWRPSGADYESLVEVIRCAGTLPTLVPWPIPPGWVLTDFGCVARPDRDATASFVTCSGPSDPDGVVELTVVSEEPGVGLGARCAGVSRTDPGADIGEGPPHAKVRVDGHPVPLWVLLTTDVDPDLDRFVFVGEAQGRWLWVVLRPASAALLLKDEWVLTDITELGPELVELPFGDVPPAW